MPRKNSLPDLTEDITEGQEKAAKQIEQFFDDHEDVSREEKATSIEALLYAQATGKIKIPSNQLVAINLLSKKYIEQAATQKVEAESVDTLMVLSTAFKDNENSFSNLLKISDEFYELEIERRAQLEASMAEVSEDIDKEAHTPDLTGGGLLGENLNDLLSGIDQTNTKGTNLPPPGSSGWDEVPLLSPDGVQSESTTTGLPHKSR